MKLVVPVVRPINFPIGRTVVAALAVVVALVVVAIWPFAFCCVRCDCRYSTQHATTINHIEWSQWGAGAGEQLGTKAGQCLTVSSWLINLPTWALTMTRPSTISGPSPPKSLTPDWAPPAQRGQRRLSIAPWIHQGWEGLCSKLPAIFAILFMAVGAKSLCRAEQLTAQWGGSGPGGD